MSYTSARQRPSFIFDAELELKDAGLVAADAAGTVDSVAQIVEAGTGRFEGVCVIDVTAIEIASNDEIYKVSVQGSNSSSFASGIVDLAELSLGALEVIGGDTDSATGRYELPFSNYQNGTYYRYLRLYTDVGGTIATGINFSAFVTKRNNS
jgi:hypothetical protein